MSLLDLSNKRILITGGCGALGVYIIKTLTEHCAFVLVNDVLAEDKAEALLDAHGIDRAQVSYHYADITKPEEVKELFASFNKPPDIVCCHAGISKAIAIQDYPIDDFDAVMNLNVRAAFLVAQEASRQWLKRKQAGHLIFTSSWVQDVPWPEITPYNASKASLKMLMRGFARELAPKGIRANAIAPGIVAAGMAKKQLDEELEYKKRALRAVPIGYMQPPESVAHAFLFLCSDMASYMTGAVLQVDGGASLYPMDEE